MSSIRNFAIIAHIDHGKSTLADRLLEKTHTVKTGLGAQLLDTMDLEKERGITIKLNPARMNYRHDNQDYQLNLIDTPGHVDFGYEVSRSLAAVEGVLLLVDASQGIQAQTLTNLNLARQLNLAVIPVINKIDLPTAQIEDCAEQIMKLLHCSFEDICLVSGKTGQGVEELLVRIVSRIPAPNPAPNAPLRALIFDSFFDQFLGVIAYIKVVDGQIKQGDRLVLPATQSTCEANQLGFMQIKRVVSLELKNGEIGYIATGLKNIQECRVGDTLMSQTASAEPLPGYQLPKPMVFASFFPEPGEERLLTAALEKLKLNDASLVYEPVHSQALGPGYSMGFLGLLHLEIVKERLEREYEVSVLVTTPTVAYRLDGNIKQEPWVDLEIVAPHSCYGAVTELTAQYRAEFQQVEYIGDRVVCHYQAPLAEIIIDFYDRLKSVTAGYASMDYQITGYREADLVAVDLMIAGDKIDAFTQYMVRSKAERYGRHLVEKLKDLIPRQNFEVSLQAAIGGKIIARADLPAFRKDVTAKLYGGDVTRKKKLLEKQKKGKKRLRQLGRVEIPTAVFVDLLRQ